MDVWAEPRAFKCHLVAFTLKCRQSVYLIKNVCLNPMREAVCIDPGRENVGNKFGALLKKCGYTISVLFSL